MKNFEYLDQFMYNDKVNETNLQYYDTTNYTISVHTFKMKYGFKLTIKTNGHIIHYSYFS